MATSTSPQSIPGVCHIVAIASGKGGVGKSTTTVNLAAALHLLGLRVGILDADIYGPNIPNFLGVAEIKPEVHANRLSPVMSHGIATMSIGYLVAAEQALIWRGPMMSSALTQICFDTNWGTLDYLLVDLPPGTGDIPLSLVQKVKLTGVIVVSTPQDIALLDVEKSINMFNKVQTPILGVVENMQAHLCSHCGHLDPIFGSEGMMRLAEKHELPVLGQIPLTAEIRLMSDQGFPIVLSQPESAASKAYQQLASALVEVAASRGRAQPKFPKISITTS
jgi:ATP-binding protein involved in chromosome partitioning